MTRKELGLALAIALGAVSLLAAPSARAAMCFGACTCSTSCDQICRDGPLIPDCPECGLTTCGEYGVCLGTCPDCDNNGWTTTQYGTSGGDTMTGTSANERFFGYDGADTIYGYAGDDTVFAGNGHDTVYGGSGDDCLYGEGGDDSLIGETGWDFADGGPGNDGCSAEIEVNCDP